MPAAAAIPSSSSLSSQVADISNNKLPILKTLQTTINNIFNVLQPSTSTSTSTLKGKYIKDSSNQIFFLTNKGVLKRVTDNRTSFPIGQPVVLTQRIGSRDKYEYFSFKYGTEEINVVMGSDLSNNSVIGNEGRYLLANQLFPTSNSAAPFADTAVIYKGCYRKTTNDGLELYNNATTPVSPWQCKHAAMMQGNPSYGLSNCNAVTGGIECSCYIGSVSNAPSDASNCSLNTNNPHNHTGVTLNNSAALYDVSGGVGKPQFFNKAGYVDADSNLISLSMAPPFNTAEDNSYTSLVARYFNQVFQSTLCENTNNGCKTACDASANCWGYQLDTSQTGENKWFSGPQPDASNIVYGGANKTLFLRQKKTFKEGLEVTTTKMQHPTKTTDFIADYLQNQQYSAAIQLMDSLDTKILEDLIRYNRNAGITVQQQSERIAQYKQSLDASFADLFATVETTHYENVDVENKFKDEYLSMIRHKYILFSWSFLSLCAIAIFIKVNNKKI